MTATADILDQHPDAGVCVLPWRSFGGREAFAGEIETLRCPGDNTWLKATVAEPGAGRILVVDGGGALDVALLGDTVATTAAGNGWAGLVINGAVRDSQALRGVAIGIVALGTCPRPSAKAGAGSRGEPVSFGGLTFAPGATCYGDADGVVVLPATRS
jgi:regulator of ribonuclease activity A